MMSYNSRMHPIEKLLIIEFRPIFIGSEFIEEENTLNIIISCSMFSEMTIEERIQKVYDVINKEKHEYGNITITIQAFNEREINDILETLL